MPFRPCPSGCGHFLSADDGHDRCLQCLGLRHAEAAFVDDSCVCCGRMSMISLRSRLSFMKGLTPSGSSRGLPADALGDLRVTVRASPPGTSPRTSYSSRSEHPVRFPGDFAGPSHRSYMWIGCRLQHRGMGSRPLRMKVRWGCPPRVLSPPPHRTWSWRPCLSGQPWVSGWRSTDRPVPSPHGWTIGFSERGVAHNRALLWCLSSRRCMRSWRSRGWPLSLDSVKLKFLSLKTALLTALTSIKRVGDLQAFSVSEECLVFGPVYSHVVLRPRPGYVTKVPTTPFRDQVVNLQALPSEEADPALALLCPVRALRIYVDRTRSIRSSEQLFVCHGGQQKGKAVSKQRLAHWIVEAVALAYQSQGMPCPLGVRAHSTRSVASSHALAHGASLADICRAAGWATLNTFAKFYNLRVEPVSSCVLGK